LNEDEKSTINEIIGRIANSSNNNKISADAQRRGFTDPLSAIQAAKQIANARREAFEKTLPKGKANADSPECS
jgi:hypothetical protein